MLETSFFTRLGSLLIVVTNFLGATRSALSDESIPTIDEVIENIRTNESLYSNIEIIVNKVTDLNPASKPFETPNIMERSESRYRVIHQDGMQYQHFLERNRSIGQSDFVQYENRAGYDGHTFRSVTNDDLANLIEGEPRAIDYRFTPHVLMFSSYNHDSLESILSNSVKKVSTGGGKANRHSDCRVIGFENVSGLRCVKLLHREWMEKSGSEKGSHNYYWLAVDRNYIPAKILSRSYRISKDFDAHVNTIDEWGEVKTGIWYPKRATVLIYSPEVLIDYKKQLLAQTLKYDVEFISVAPNYDVDFFRRIDIPAGAKVHILKHGQIVRSYVQKSSKSYRWIMIALIAVVTFIVVFVFIRYTRKRSIPKRKVASADESGVQRSSMMNADSTEVESQGD
jgi:hypothetical protein